MTPSPTFPIGRPAVGSWAVVNPQRPGWPDVLMLVDDEREAQEIAFELRGQGRKVLVVGVSGPELRRSLAGDVETHQR